MLTITTRLWARLDSAAKIAISENARQLSTLLGSQFKLGTGCSGTDVVVLSLQDFFHFLKAECGCDLHVDHLFSCENVDFKQAFLEWFFPDAVVFPDLHKLDRTETEDKDGTLQRIPSVGLFCCGIECDSISSLNIHRSENHGCVDKDTEETKTGAAGYFSLSAPMPHAPCSMLHPWLCPIPWPIPHTMRPVPRAVAAPWSLGLDPWSFVLGSLVLGRS